jgi:phosphatidate cytidylyltransferase
MIKRILSALVGAPLLLILTWLADFIWPSGCGLALLSLREFLRLAERPVLQHSPIYRVILCFMAYSILIRSYRWLLPLG